MKKRDYVGSRLAFILQRRKSDDFESDFMDFYMETSQFVGANKAYPYESFSLVIINIYMEKMGKKSLFHYDAVKLKIDMSF